MKSFKTLLSGIKWKYYLNYIIIGIIALILAIITSTGGIKSSNLYLLEKITMNITLAVSLSLVVGFLGELSLGHAGFMCIGAYFGGITSMIIDNGGLIKGDGVLSFVISMVVGAVVAGIFGFVIGLPALRLRGDYLAIVTLAFGEIVKTIFRNTSNESFGGTLGLATPRYNKNTLFIYAFLMVLACLAVIDLHHRELAVGGHRIIVNIPGAAEAAGGELAL